MTLKERFLKLKAAFDGTPPAAPAPPAAAAPAPPAAPPAPSGMTSCSYNVDGGTPVYVNIADDGIPDIDMNDAVFSDAAMTIPYPDGTYKVTGTDFSFTVAGGLVTVVTDADNKGPGAPIESAMAKPPAAPPAPPPAAPAAAPPQPVTLSQMTVEQVQAMYLKFATGSPEERLAGLEIMVKALMECNFGWKIREGNENTAIEVYKDTIASTPVVTIDQMNSAFTKAEEQAAIITRHEETIKALLELTEQLVEMPTADPTTLTGVKKDRFDRSTKREQKFENIAAALKQAKAKN